jgi:ketosteroid isomerase-like protein
VGAEENVKTVQTMYEAFGRADIATLLEALTEDVDWGSDTASTGAPWYGIRHGKAQVTDFFQAFGETMDVQEFTPNAYAANDTEVHTVVHMRTTARSTGRAVEMNLHHYFRFRDGKVEFYRGSEDTAQVVTALQP